MPVAVKYSSLQLNEVQNQEFTNQIILLLPASCLLPPASCLKTSDFVPHAKENCCKHYLTYFPGIEFNRRTDFSSWRSNNIVTTPLD